MIDGRVIQDTAVEEALKALENDESQLGDAIQVIQQKLPDAPTTAGTYVLQVVVTSSGATYSWVAK